MLEIVLATRNEGKAREFGRLLGPGFQVRPTPFDIAMPEETGSTFMENATLKAETVSAALEGAVAVLADDSGLEVSALRGLPGIHSARYAGPDASDEENVERLLADLDGQAFRDARFVCVLVLLPARGNGTEMVRLSATGELRGRINERAKGANGFGYDPVFVPEGWDKALAEVSGAEKDAVSHRAAAVVTLKHQLSLWTEEEQSG